MLTEPNLLNLPKHQGTDGCLIALEVGELVSFSIKRVFYIYGVQDASVQRGNHANRRTEMLMVALSGSVKVKVDDGKSLAEFNLNTPDKALYLPKMTWKEMSGFSPDCVLMVLASGHYDKTEYITDYAEFKREVLR